MQPIHELFDTEKAIYTLSMMNSITVLAPAFGPLFGAMILHFSTWRSIFYLLAIWARSLFLRYFSKCRKPTRISMKRLI